MRLVRVYEKEHGFSYPCRLMQNGRESPFSVFARRSRSRRLRLSGVIFDTIKSAVGFGRHVPRYREILGVLMKYGFADVLRLVVLQKLLNINEPIEIRPGASEILSKPLPVRIRLALEELGPTFIKFGQILSSRRDLVTEEYVAEISKLQDEVPPFPSAEARRILRHELGEMIDVLFDDFEEKPIGGASIAQVHRARLKDGQLVAIKVQRPDIEKVIELDLAILRDLAFFVERHVPEIAVLNPVGVVTEFAETLLLELDFENEASNAERFALQFQSDPTIHAPRVFRELTTSRVLTMEFISGIHIDEREELEKAGISAVELSERVTVLIYKQIFEYGFFHADPHPGNMTILPGGVVALYDFGMMGTFTPKFRESIAMMILGLAEKDHQRTMQSLLEMSDEGVAPDATRMLREVESFSDQHLNQPLREIRLGHVLNKLLDLLRSNQLRMKSNFYLGIKALAQVEAVGQELNPDLNFIKLGEPYALKIVEGKYAPARLFFILQKVLSESVDFLQDFPHDFRTAYENIKRGKYSIPLEHKIDPQGFEPLRKTLDSIANRLTNAILAASVLICSSIVILAGVPPHIEHVSIPGILGLLFGSYMCLRLVLTIWKHGGL